MKSQMTHLLPIYLDHSFLYINKNIYWKCIREPIDIFSKLKLKWFYKKIYFVKIVLLDKNDIKIF